MLADKKIMQTQEITIVNKLGLHARASAKLTKLAGSFQCDVWMSKGQRRVNAKSIMGVMMLAAACGARLELCASGPEAEPALEQLDDLVRRRFDEDE